MEWGEAPEEKLVETPDKRKKTEKQVTIAEPYALVPYP